MKSINSVEEYIELYPGEVQFILNKIRQIVLMIVPEAVESISYGMPAYKLNKKPLIILQLLKITLVCMQRPTDIKHLKKNLLVINKEKVPFNFHWTKKCLIL